MADQLADGRRFRALTIMDGKAAGRAASGYVLIRAISSRAREPPRSKVLPVAVTRSPANLSSFGFWPAAGVEPEIGQ